MIDRLSCGLIPAKPHTALRLPGGRLVHEEMFTRGGFDGPFTCFYHLHPITAARRVTDCPRGWVAPTLVPEGVHPLRRRLYDANQGWAALASRPRGALDARLPLLFNRDLVVLLASPALEDDVFFANNDGDELWYFARGSATLQSVCGTLEANPGDYVLVPRSLIHRWVPREGEPIEALVIEARRGCHIPDNFRNQIGQLLPGAPYSHRDFVRPSGPIATPEETPEGPASLVIKRGDRFSLHELERCPLDVIGWDGFVYPFAFAIEKYQPRTGAIHQPPTIHTTFVGPGYAVCSFVPRLVDFHKDAIPCPYPHSSVDCDEIILYLKGNFTSRRGVGPGSISLHPSGVAHGPHPGAYEASIGAVRTDELAVMLDTFLPLLPTPDALSVERHDYHDSWKTT
ncbi:MAG: homogentisate 1,2-dioxygenase [Polyangiaceae bacterium]|nr:homogentisate 1,2-dioxygenase [Polyangiaceae bacterium]